MYFRNVWAAIRVLFCRSTSFRKFVVNLDRVGNALCGGDYRSTISARVGFFALVKRNWYWKSLEWLIDLVFYPLDGPRHCFVTYQDEKHLNYRRSSDIALFFLSLIVIVACLIIAPVALVASLF